MGLELSILVAALVISMVTRPWRLLAGGALLTPLLAILVILPWLWALPRLHTMPLQLQFSGACAVTLMLGWPLAVPALLVVSMVSALLAPADFNTLLEQVVWQGVVPATMAMAIGAALRHWAGTHPFVFILARAFGGTVLCTFAASSLALMAGHELQHVGQGLSLVARWLMAWGDGFMTGMMAAIFVAFRPQWLATWSDRLYLKD
jgi:uncharacterized membrane protein